MQEPLFDKALDVGNLANFFLGKNTALDGQLLIATVFATIVITLALFTWIKLCHMCLCVNLIYRFEVSFAKVILRGLNTIRVKPMETFLHKELVKQAIVLMVPIW